MKKSLMDDLKRVKKVLEKDGFIIDGVFGSVSRDEEKDHSDIDILYSINQKFLDKYGSFKAFKKLEEIKDFLKTQLKRDVDLAPKNNLSNSAKKYILKDMVHV